MISKEKAVIKREQSLNNLRLNYVGKIYNYYTIIDIVGYTKNSIAICLAKCECGITKNVHLSNLKSNSIISCGCHKNDKTIERSTTHGLSKKSPLYKLWTSLKNRCYNKKSKDYKSYGGRGIVMCDEWLNDFMAFHDWCLCNGWEKGLQIDRRENDGIYSPNNCRFVTAIINANNKRNNITYIINGEKITLPNLIRKYNLPENRIRSRIRKGWDIEKAILTPKVK